jgi:hypothetical protein
MTGALHGPACGSASRTRTCRRPGLPLDPGPDERGEHVGRDPLPGGHLGQGDGGRAQGNHADAPWPRGKGRLLGEALARRGFTSISLLASARSTGRSAAREGRRPRRRRRTACGRGRPRSPLTEPPFSAPSADSFLPRGTARTTSVSRSFYQNGAPVHRRGSAPAAQRLQACAIRPCTEALLRPASTDDSSTRRRCPSTGVPRSHRQTRPIPGWNAGTRRPTTARQ